MTGCFSSLYLLGLSLSICWAATKEEVILWKVMLRVGSVAFSAGGIILGVWKVEVIIGEICACGWLVGGVGGTRQALHISLEDPKIDSAVYWLE